MTGGVVVVLGRTGRNFAAGMSGGMAFVFDEAGDFADRCNLEMVSLEPFASPEDRELVRELLTRHAAATGSDVARTILDGWDILADKFVKVMPNDLKRVLEEQRKQRELEEAGLTVLGANR